MIKVLVVDDSIVFRTQISASLKDVEGVEVVGTAPNGKIAIQKLGQLSVDLVTLDMEMPEMNGLETIKELRAKGFKTKVIVFSSQTTRGAEIALEALRLGANDVVAKPSGDHLNFETAQTIIKEALVPRVLQFINAIPMKKVAPNSLRQNVEVKSHAPKINLNNFFPKALVIASSTGGPNALETIFSTLKGPFKIPVLIVQHMPPVFTQILAKRISDMVGSEVREATNNEILKAGTVYMAPGGFHMQLKQNNDRIIKIELHQGPERNSVRPAADYLFETAADIFKHQLLGVVLTGMGEDGAVGAKKIHNLGGGIIIQSKESCVVFGMPGAVYENNDFDEIKNLDEISTYLKTVLL